MVRDLAKVMLNETSCYLSRYSDNGQTKPILVPRKTISWESNAVFNPGVVRDKNIFRMLYRTYSHELIKKSPKLNSPGFNLTHQASYIGYAESRDGIHFERREQPFISPDQNYDRHGCEDPRITLLNDTFYITYTAIDAPIENSLSLPKTRIALATTKDFITVKKHGIIGPPVNSKAAAFFPERVNGEKFGLALTMSADSTLSHVAVRYDDSIEAFLQPSCASWDNFLKTNHETTLLKTEPWLHRGPELGAPPIKTDRGWLFIFSAESMSDTWTMSAALADIDEPHKLIARIPGYLLQPVMDYEREGIAPNVAFPSAAVIVEDELYVYYGCADTVIGLATCKLTKLLDYLDKFKK